MKNIRRLNFIKGEVVRLAFLFCLKEVGNRAFYRRLEKDYPDLFPQLPEKTRLFRLFLGRRSLTAEFLANPTVMGVIDAYGIELSDPIREGRPAQQIGRKTLSNHRRIVGGKRVFDSQSGRFGGGAGLRDGECPRQQISAADSRV